MRFYPGAWLVGRRISTRLQLMNSLYGHLKEDEIDAYQLKQLNRSWQVSLSQSPWARELKETLSLPESFSSLDEFKGAVPVTAKPMLTELIDRTAGAGKPVRWMATGGTSGRPFRFPVFREEIEVSRANVNWQRARYGIDHRSRGFLLWGHSHLLGRGVGRLWNRWRRYLADALMGYCRISAYDLDDDAMWRAGDMFIQTRPDYLVGYARAIERLVQVNKSRRAEFPSLRLVQPTGEAFTSPDARAEVEAFFSAPVFMEYGAVECGPIAHEEKSGWLPLWQSHLLEKTGDDELLVTSLYPRAVPLMRYQLGDQVHAEVPNRWINSLAGRMNDHVTWQGHRFHSELISHAVRWADGVSGYQVVVKSTGDVSLLLECGNTLHSATVEEIRRKLSAIEPDLANINIQQVRTLAASPSGKRPLVIREGE